MINDFLAALYENRDRVEDWFARRFREIGAPLYVSVDLRNSGHKIAVVDTNAYPAGFNNLCTKYHAKIPERFREYLTENFPGARRVLIFPEEHSRNLYYLQNVVCLERGLKEAGFEVRVGTLDPGAECASRKTLEGELYVYPLTRKNGSIDACGFVPDLIVSNNDFADGVPEILHGIGQPVVPATGLGWHRRRKHRHFEILNRLNTEFGEVCGIDPGTISTRTAWAGQVDFEDEASRERVAQKVDELMAAIAADYREKGLDDKPFVFIKNDAGTYGMAVMTARGGDEVRKATHRIRTKMKMGKGRVRVGEVLIQEGIVTRDFYQGFPMEPVIYMVGAHPVGGFYRLHRDRTPFESLNVRGMEFRKLCFHKVEEESPESIDDECEDSGKLLEVYGALARIAALAVGLEIAEMNGEEGAR